MGKEPLLSVKDLRLQFVLRGRNLNALRGVSFDLYKGETLAIVGESGSGKSVLTKCFIGMTDKNGKITDGTIMYDGMDLTKITSEKDWRKIRGKRISMVMQDPMTALNPLKTVGSQIQEAVEINQDLHGAMAKEESIKMLSMVGITEPEKRYKQYPHEFSGGMRQRAVIAIAVSCHPEILICDEPTTALDVTIQAQILELIRSLQRDLGMTIIYITHDLGVVANVADRVAVMYAGQIVETGTADEIFHDPQHPYSWALLQALPQLGEKGKPLPTIDGAPPNLYADIKGDAFAPRNHHALNIDYIEEPPFFDVSETHKVKSWNMDPRARKIDRPESLTNITGRLSNQSTEAGTGQKITSDREKLIEVKNLQVAFGRGKKKAVIVNDINFDIYKGETFALVGESGSGKTTIGRAILRINPVTEGEVRYKGQKISGKISKELDEEVIKGCQMVFQDPMSSLNERAKVDYIVSEGLQNFHMYKDKEDLENKVENALTEVGLLPEFASRFPHEFSGGQRQRIGIARALIMEPDFIVADEPISALDVSIRAQILNLMNRIQQEREIAYLFIAHDLSVVRFISDRIAVIYKGRIVELAEAEELFRHPLHPYTKALMSAVPIPDPEMEKNKKLIIYDPSVHDYSVDKPQWREICNGHFIYGNERELDGYRAEMGM